MEEKTFNEWWEENENMVLKDFPNWSDVEKIKKLCADCWTTQNTNCEIRIAELDDDYDDASDNGIYDGWDED